MTEPTRPDANVESLPSTYNPPSPTRRRVDCIEGVVASLVNPNPRTIREAYAKGLVPAHQGEGFILNEEEYYPNEDGVLMDGELLIFVERADHAKAREDYQVERANVRLKEAIRIGALRDKLGEGVSLNPGGSATLRTDGEPGAMPVPPDDTARLKADLDEMKRTLNALLAQGTALQQPVGDYAPGPESSETPPKRR